jgi:hypothetical protein
LLSSLFKGRGTHLIRYTVQEGEDVSNTIPLKNVLLELVQDKNNEAAASTCNIGLVFTV